MKTLGMVFQRVVQLSAMIAACSAAGQASVIYNVSVNTSTVSGTSGFLEFQFNPGNAGSQSATASIQGFTSSGTLVGAPSVTGNVTGTLPSTVTFSNSTAFNDYFQQFTYGSGFSFQLVLDGPAITSPNGTSTAGTTFGLSLYDSGQNPILTNQGAGTGFAGKVDILLTGGTQATTYSGNAGGTAPSVVTLAQVSAVPEPGMFVLLGSGLVGLILRRRLVAA